MVQRFGIRRTTRAKRAEHEIHPLEKRQQSEKNPR
jgi:hypothetical protein